jgi:hypothetical protein
MNTSYSKRRHIQESNALLEKRLLNKLINEQQDPKMGDLPPSGDVKAKSGPETGTDVSSTPQPIKIKVTLAGNQELYFDIDRTEPGPQGCDYYGKVRNRSDIYSINWKPLDRLNVQVMNMKPEGSSFFGTISEKAAELLENACGNKDYASINNTGSSNYA